MEENLSPQQSLSLIQAMIDKTKSNISRNRVYFLLWGWLSFTGILGQFFLKVVVHYRHHYLIWLITLIGVGFSIAHTRRERSRTVVRTYIDDAMSYLWSGMAISFFVLSFIITFMQVDKTGWMYCYPFFILLYGLGTFVSGKILQFRPLVIGGIFNWLLACGAVFFPFDYQLLFAAAAILTSYIIPGHLIQSKKEIVYEA
ncbi:MAG TPA: hypothetical protein VM871_08175 [Flavisolibacter sp.]|jgi:hypothetical protein|nr:hypothetical protein [Flavisolibacter sp.]